MDCRRVPVNPDVRQELAITAMRNPLAGYWHGLLSEIEKIRKEKI